MSIIDGMVTNVDKIQQTMANKSLKEEINSLIQLESTIPAHPNELIEDINLTSRQLIFVSEYCKSGEARASAIKAGYSASSAAVTAHELLNKPKIIQAVDKVWAAMRLASEEPKNRIEQELYEILIEAKASSNHLVMLKAIDQICKINGLYTPNVQLNQDNSVQINYIVPDTKFNNIEEI